VLKGNIEDRIAKLSGGISMIKVGGLTPSEVDEKIDRVDDAVCAVRSAKEEGVVAGGGTALFWAEIQLDLDEVTSKSIDAPIKRILANAGITSFGDTLFEYPKGYDVKNFQEVNMFDAGIIDSKKAIRNALINAVSASNTLLRSRNVLTYSNQ
jgi:chaperonin GroEL